MNIDPNIFKPYDIRGIYPTQLNDELAYLLGKAFIKFLEAKKVIVSRDIRLSSLSLSQNLIKGLLEAGADVTDIGLATTPLFYFTAAEFDFDGGLHITASHNPKEYNGFKMVAAEGISINENTGILQIRDLIIKGFKAGNKQPGKLSQLNPLQAYINRAYDYVPANQIKKFKIVVDTGNGMGGLVFPEFFKHLPCQIIPLYWELDGTFPNHLSDPLIIDTLKDIQKKIISEKADLGIATDGDGDRIFFLDEQGQVIKSEYIASLVAQIILSQHPKSKILYNAPASKSLKDVIIEAGGQPVVFRSGHSFIKQKMKQDKIIFGVEASGHYYMKDKSYREVPLIIILYLLKALTQKQQSFSRVIQPFKKYFSSEELNFEIKDLNKIINKIEKYYNQGEISHIDGTTIEFKDWWFNLRASNTQPLIRLNIEASNALLLASKIKEITALITQI